ncbi:hypothetical protein E2C01_101256 [Portunus trituberculatus]|uniref:Uncharacterized protein n=1 Tax=Portunus trituberculatus TaxID=210409 RepID=A0A5B7KEA8_PORTR|nr:hypothetical protein [Portunus trituberculatus]
MTFIAVPSEEGVRLFSSFAQHWPLPTTSVEVMKMFTVPSISTGRSAVTDTGAATTGTSCRRPGVPCRAVIGSGAVMLSPTLGGGPVPP